MSDGGHDHLSVKELKQRLQLRGISYEGCVEKAELIRLLEETPLADAPPQVRQHNHGDTPDGTPPRSEAQGFFASVKEMYNALVEMIVRPPRACYSLSDLGPSKFQLPHAVGNPLCMREDFALYSGGVVAAAGADGSDNTDQPERHQMERRVLRASLFRQAAAVHAPVPCVVYCHGNAGCRADCLELVPSLLSMGIAVACFDFSGCGMSEGDHVTLGAQEVDDLAAVIEWLRRERAELIGPIAVWGRSMGAVTALLYCLKLQREKDRLASGGGGSGGDRAQSASSISNPATSGLPVALVLDSAFSSLTEVCHEMAVHFTPVRLPRLAVAAGIRMIRSSIQSRAGFDIYDLDAVSQAPQLVAVPALFTHGRQDDFVAPHHTERVFEKYGCPDKHILLVEGDHNSVRPDYFHAAAFRFLLERFLLPVPAPLLQQTNEYFGGVADSAEGGTSHVLQGSKARHAKKRSAAKRDPVVEQPSDGIPEEEDVALQEAIHQSLK